MEMPVKMEKDYCLTPSQVIRESRNGEVPSPGPDEVIKNEPTRLDAADDAQTEHTMWLIYIYIIDSVEPCVR